MLSKKYFASTAAALLVFLGGTAVFAQTGPVRGKVELRKADGTTEPVAGAKIDVYRTDAKGKAPSAKTNKKGEFAFAGLPYGQKFVFVVSGEKIAPGMQPNITAGAENVVITVSEGDGKVLTESEVRASLSGNTPSNNTSANAATTPATATPAATPAPADNQQSAASNMSPEELKKAQEEAKKAQAEYEKKKAEVEASNKKITESNTVIKASLDEGNKAFDAKNYDLAVSKYDEGINASPDFIGSAPVLLNNKATVLVVRATNNYNTAVKAGGEAKTAAMPGIKKDYEDAAASASKALEILKTAPAGDPNQKNYDAQKATALLQRKEAYRLMVKTGADRTKGKETATAFEEYLASETDPKKKADTQLAFAEALQDTNEFDQAATEFEKVLAADPNNVDALVGAGLSLVNVGYVSGDKTKFQQAANYLQKFDDLAPATHRYKADAKGIIETLKNEQKVTPQKVTTKKKS